MARQLVERHGVVTREAVLAEGVVGGYASVYGVLKVLEERGQVRRGYFVSGLGAAQFALPGAVDRLRQAREPSSDGHDGHAAHRPSCWPPRIRPSRTAPRCPGRRSAGRPARTGAAVVVLRDGVPLAWYDRRSHHLVTFPPPATTRAGRRRWPTRCGPGGPARSRSARSTATRWRPHRSSPRSRRRRGRRVHRRLSRADVRRPVTRRRRLTSGGAPSAGRPRPGR